MGGGGGKMISSFLWHSFFFVPSLFLQKSLKKKSKKASLKENSFFCESQGGRLDEQPCHRTNWTSLSKMT